MNDHTVPVAMYALGGTHGAPVSPKPNTGRLRINDVKRALVTQQNQFSWHPGRFAQTFEPALSLPLIQFNVGVAFFYTGHRHPSSSGQMTIFRPIPYAACLHAFGSRAQRAVNNKQVTS